MGTYDPFVHQIGNHDSNIGIWIQYQKLVELSYKMLEDDEFNRSFTIIPMLHLMSHAIELGLKENIAFLKDEFPDFKSSHDSGLKMGFNMTHNAYKLFRIFKDYIQHKVSTFPGVDKDLKKETKNLLLKLGEFISDVNPKTTTYRYSHIINLNGDVELSIPSNKKIKIDLVFGNFMEAQKLLLYTQQVFTPWYDFRDFMKIMPMYSDGVGYLWEPKSKFFIHPQYNVTWSDRVSWIERHNIDGSRYFTKKEKNHNEEEISSMNDDDPFKSVLLSTIIDDKYLQRYFHIKTIIDRKIYYDNLRNQYFEFYELEGFHWTPVISKETFNRKYSQFIKT